MRQRKKRIIYALDKLSVGGTQKNVFETALQARRDGLDVTVAGLLSGGDFADKLKNEGIRVEIITQGNAGPFKTACVISGLARLVREIRPDVLQTYLFYANFAGAAVKTVFPRLKLITCNRQASYVREKKRPAARAFINRMADRIVVNSKAARDWMISSERVELKKIAVVSNGIDTRRFREKMFSREEVTDRYGLDRFGLRLINVANLTEVKGHLRLLEVFRDVLKKIPDAVLFLAGDGPEKERLEKSARKLGVEKQVVFAGQVPDAWRMLSGFDVFVFSSYSEGFPNAVIEAMLAGLAVVSTDAGGCAEIIRHQKTGLLVPGRNLEGMTEQIIRLGQNPGERKRLGINAKHAAEKKFSVSRQNQRLYELAGL